MDVCVSISVMLCNSVKKKGRLDDSSSTRHFTLVVSSARIPYVPRIAALKS